MRDRGLIVLFYVPWHNSTGGRKTFVATTPYRRACKFLPNDAEQLLPKSSVMPQVETKVVRHLRQSCHACLNYLLRDAPKRNQKNYLPYIYLACNRGRSRKSASESFQIFGRRQHTCKFDRNPHKKKPVGNWATLRPHNVWNDK
jgi:hypothetical protein